LLLALPVGLLVGIGVRSGDWVLVAGAVGLVVVFAGLLLLWLANHERSDAPLHQIVQPLAIEAPKPVSPLTAGAFVVDVPAETGGA
jgi:hypothetical protein